MGKTDLSNTVAVAMELVRRFGRRIVPTCLLLNRTGFWLRAAPPEPGRHFPTADARDMLAGRLLRALPPSALARLWQCEGCGLARPILDDDWTCDCGPSVPQEGYNWRRVRVVPEAEDGDPFSALAARALDLPPGTELFPEDG